MNTRSSNILILGLAREGVVLARFFAGHGAAVTVTDSAAAERLQRQVDAVPHGIDLALGEDRPDLVERADRFFVSPGVPESNPVYQAAVSRGLAIESMTTLFFDLCPAPIIGVTGSSGKTTTTGLIGHILRQAGMNAAVGGNIGDPMLELLPSITRSTNVVLELSSFQLSILRRSPQIAVVTNISPNHLDRHGSMADYIRAKRHIVDHQRHGDHAVLNADDPAVAQFATSTPGEIRWFGPTARADGAVLLDNRIGLRRNERVHTIMSVSDIPLLGRHNIENVMAAVATADIVGISPEHMAAAVRSFRPAPHRLQTVADIQGVRYIDDSIATSPARACVALDAIDGPLLVIAGGRDKHVPWDAFAVKVAQRARALFLLGEAAPLIEQAVLEKTHDRSDLLRRDAVIQCASLEEAVQRARAMAHPGDAVVLSPGCASYDMFTDFEERGRVFVRAVEGLKHAA
ncbi:MAG TPA: UDP-N-acetylmuramoyl-L-alanine--D-glutamate ligase [Chloroflexota bacterium]